MTDKSSNVGFGGGTASLDKNKWLILSFQHLKK